MGAVILKSSFLFDFDGTLVDSVYQHALAWREALEGEGIDVSIWRIHRKIGMSSGLLTDMLLCETGLRIDLEGSERLRHLHAAAFNRLSACIRPLPGARERLTFSPIPKSPGQSGRADGWRRKALSSIWIRSRSDA